VKQTSRTPAKSKNKAAVAKDNQSEHAPERLVPVIIPTAEATKVQGELAQLKEKAARKPQATKKAPAVVAKPTVEPTRRSERRNVATTAMQESDGVSKTTQSVPKKTAAPSIPTRKARSIPSDAGDDDEDEDAEDAESVEGKEGEVGADNHDLISKQAMGVQKKYFLGQGTHLVGDYSLPLLPEYEHLIPDSALLSHELEQRRKLKIEKAKNAAEEAGVPYEPPRKAPKKNVYKWWELLGDGYAPGTWDKK
jgi:hypothetical protein